MVEYRIHCYLFVRPSDPEVPFLFRFIDQLVKVSGVFSVNFRKKIEKSSKIECFRRKTRKMTKTNKKIKLNLKPGEKKLKSDLV